MKIPVRALIRNSNVVARSANGSWITGVCGKRYLDLTSGIGTLSTGHCHPTVVEKVTRQVGTMVHAQMNCFKSNVEQEELLRKLDQIFPRNFGTTYFTTSGSDAIENSIKIARKWTKKTNIISFLGGFHGRTLGCMSIGSSRTSCRSGYQPLMPGVFHVPYPKEGVYQSTEKSMQALEDVLNLATAPDETAAIIMEPILGEGGIIAADKEFGKNLRKLCDKHNILWVSDEVQTGVGRTGNFWGYERFGKDVHPDMIVYGKGIASGFPLAGVSAPKEMFEAVHPGGMGGTYNGGVISVSAANATLDIIRDEDLVSSADEKGKRFADGIIGLKSQYVKEVRNYGLMLAVKIDLDAINFRKLVLSSSDHGILILTAGTDSTIRLLPPLNIKDEEIDEGVVRIGQMLHEIP